MADIIFANGMSVFEPNDKAPDFIKKVIYIDPIKFFNWAEKMKQHETDKGYLKFNLCKSKKDTFYIQLDTYKPQNKTEPF